MTSLTGRAVMRKEPRVEMPKLRKSARDCPYCMYCLIPNIDGNLVLAHGNWLEMGKGVGLKVSDILGAILCQPCHDFVDGRRGNKPEQERREMWGIAHVRTLLWWVSIGLLRT